MVMSSSSHDLPLPPKSLQIKQDDKFFSRLLSKENSMANNSSFRVLYYGGASGTIPFRWESRPGTPKHTLFSDTCNLPPLTPPPSYHFNSKLNKSMQQSKNKKPNILYTIFPRLAPKKLTHVSPLSSSPSLSSSRSYSSTSSSMTPNVLLNPRRRRCSFSHSTTQYELDDHEHGAFESPTSNGFRGCFLW